MVSAVVLLNVERSQRVRTNEELADLVTARMLKLEGIQSTETLIAFRAYSRHDLEAAFSLGPKDG
jgi:hypothetical protein